MSIARRTTYEQSRDWSRGGPHPKARLFVLSHRPAREISETQMLITTGIEYAVSAAREAAGVSHVHYEVVR